MDISTSDALALGALDAHDQAQLVARGELTPAELVAAAIERIERLNPPLNVITWKAYDQALARAEEVTARTAAAAPSLNGVPCLLKESLDYRGMPNRCASRSRSGEINTTVEFEYARRLDAHGLIQLGKTSTPEFSLLATTEPVLYGAARNPWNTRYSVGGSSGGAAAAVACGMVPVAHGGDGGGSIRIPASCCGVVGFKTGRGHNVRARAHHLLEDLLVSDVLLTRSVRDTDWAVAIAARQQPAVMVRGSSRERLRIGVMMQNLWGNAPHREVAECTQRAADLCARLGHHVEAVPGLAEGSAIIAGFRTLWAYLALEIAGQDRQSSESELENWTLGLADWAARRGAADLDAAHAGLALASRTLDQLFGAYDVVLSPVTSEPPLEIGRLAPQQPFEPLFEEMFRYISYTPLHNMAGTPAISLPLFMSRDGLPIGTLFASARGREARLLALAYELEAAQPWSQRWPPVSIAASAH